MTDYKNGKIYCITSGNLYYIGSTINSLEVRLSAHKHKYKLWKNDKHHFVSSFKIIQDCEKITITTTEIKGNKTIITSSSKEPEIILYENYSCENRKDLELKEAEIIKKYKTDYGDKCVNILINDKTNQEIKNKRREKALINSSNYYENNKEKCLTEMKKRYENNKEAIRERVANYRANNLEKIKERLSEKIKCECGIEILKCNLNRHLKSKNHN